MFFNALGKFVTRYWIAIIVAWAALAIALYAFVPDLGQVASSEEANFLPEQSDSIQAKKLLDRYFPSDSFSSRVVLTAEKESPLSEEDLKSLDTLAEAIAKNPANANIGKVLTPVNTPFLKDKLISKDGKAALAVFYLGTNFIARDTQATVKRIGKAIRKGPPGITLEVTGDALVGYDYHHAIGYSLDKTTWATLLLLVAILVFIFRSPVTPLVSLVSIIVSFVIAKSVAALFAVLGATVSPLTEIFLVVVIFGAGSNYCVFLIFRYYEEFSKGMSSAQAVETSVRTVGEAISSSAFTVIIGLGSLIFAQFGPFSQTGPYVALGVAIALAAGITLTPSLILALRKILFWPSGMLHQELDPLAWKRILNFVVHKPFWTTGLLLAGMGPLIYFGLQTQRSFDLFRELPEQFPSRRGMQILKDHFSPGEMSPLVLVLQTKPDLRKPAALDQIYQLTKALSNRPQVQEVLSAVWPTGEAHLLDAGLLGEQVQRLREGLQKLNEGNEKIHAGLQVLTAKIGAFQSEKSSAQPSQASASAREQSAKVLAQLEKTITSVQASRQEALEKSRKGGILAGPAQAEYERAAERLLKLQEGLKRIRDGLAEFAKQISQLQERAEQSTRQLQEGLAKLSQGTAEISKGLQSALDATDNWLNLSRTEHSVMDHLILPADILQRQPKLRDAWDYYISPDGSSTRLILVLNAVPYSEQEKDDILALKEFLKSKISEIFPYPCRFHFAGSGSTILDERIVTDQDFWRIIGYVLAGIFLVLLLLLRQWLAPLYLIVTMIFTYFVTLGLTYLVFECGMHQQGLDWKVPFFLFVLLIALGEDYNIFLMARIKEETRRQGIVPGVFQATVRTGPLITFCGLIMAGTFLSLMLSPLEALMQLGFGITAGVLLDTFLVRPLLVPSLVILAHRLAPPRLAA